jgi:Ni,Fe-hydrogenase I small subunit
VKIIIVIFHFLVYLYISVLLYLMGCERMRGGTSMWRCCERSCGSTREWGRETGVPCSSCPHTFTHFTTQHFHREREKRKKEGKTKEK